MCVCSYLQQPLATQEEVASLVFLFDPCLQFQPINPSRLVVKINGISLIIITMSHAHPSYNNLHGQRVKSYYCLCEVV